MFQCHEIGTIVPLCEIQKKVTTRDMVEVIENPFDNSVSFLEKILTLSKEGNRMINWNPFLY
ncbi:MAG: hypothetical protein M3P28_10110 [Thermoproteota archaeon]|nr:hypothetical protein [Thermoproteota archaeon]